MLLFTIKFWCTFTFYLFKFLRNANNFLGSKEVHLDYSMSVRQSDHLTVAMYPCRPFSATIFFTPFFLPIFNPFFFRISCGAPTPV